MTCTYCGARNPSSAPPEAEPIKPKAQSPAPESKYFLTLREQASDSTNVSNRAVVLLTVSAVLGSVFAFIMLCVAIGSSDYENPDKAGQVTSSLIYLFGIWVSYIITVPVFKYMAVRSREIAERKD